MPAEIILQRTPDDVALLESREQLARLRGTLAEMEEELAQLRTQLKAFESRYFRKVGVLYAELDELEARIREREADLYDSDAARQRADEARRQAEQSREAASEEAEQKEDFDPPPSLKAVFREVARRIHPDYARDEAEAQYFTLLMARANAAYRRGDADLLQRLLNDQRELHTFSDTEDASAQLQRVSRQIHHAKRDTTLLQDDRSVLLQSDIALLHAEAEAAAREHRDLLEELATGLREQICEAEHRLAFVNRQVDAHGR